MTYIKGNDNHHKAPCTIMFNAVMNNYDDAVTNNCKVLKLHSFCNFVQECNNCM